MNLYSRCAQRSVTWVGLALLVGAGCKQLTLDNPDPPNTAGLQAVYDSPPGDLQAEDLRAVVDDFEARDAVLLETEDFSLAQELLEGVSSNEDVVEAGEQLDPTAGARLLAVVRAKRICLGSGGTEVVDEARFGSINLTIKASPRGLLPIVWGRFNRCVHDGPHGELVVDGEYAITARQEQRGRGFLFQFEGTIKSEEVDFEGTLDFRLRGDGTKELRLQATDGDVVVALNAAGHLVVRDRASQWECDPMAVSCTERETGRVLSAERTR